MSERDPRVDPRPGDVLRKGQSVVKIVLATEEGLGYEFKGISKECPPMPNWWEPWKPKWRKWASDAEVVKHDARN